MSKCEQCEVKMDVKWFDLKSNERSHHVRSHNTQIDFLGVFRFHGSVVVKATMTQPNTESIPVAFGLTFIHKSGPLKSTAGTPGRNFFANCLVDWGRLAFIHHD